MRIAVIVLILAAMAIILASGCAHTETEDRPRQPVVTGVEVLVPVVQGCQVVIPAPPIWPLDVLSRQATTLEKSRAALLEIEMRARYQEDLILALKRCQ